MKMKKMYSFNNNFILSKKKSHIIEKRISKYYNINDNVLEQDVNINKIIKRKYVSFSEKNYNRPQNIFFLKIKEINITIFGRKLISPLYDEKMIKSINCSMINKNMIIGLLKNYKVNKEDIIVNYYPLNNGERLKIFNTIKKNRMINISYPFKYYDYYTKKEIDSPIDGWKVNKNIALNLYNGEKHFRKYTIKIMKKLGVKNGAVLFDPACSTGDFLHEIKQYFPKTTTIGQDLSKEMADISKEKIDIVYTGDSAITPIKNESVDFLFLRFLNSKVVTTAKAKELYNILIEKVNKGGYIICFGHTPILLELDYIHKYNLELLLCNGYCQKYDSIFQYYVFRRIL